METHTIPITRAEPQSATNVIGLRAFFWGTVLCALVAALNAYLETAVDVHFAGGTQLPLGALFVLLLITLGFNGLTKRLNSRLLRPFNAAELITIYVMCSMAALVSVPGNENSFLTTCASLFYFSTRENGWAEVFYRHIPSWWAPGWDGQKFDAEVIDNLYLGGISARQIPWHAWTAMLSGWTIFCALLYGLLFFTSLLFRRQWIENEALSFPLVQLPMEMVKAKTGEEPPIVDFWANRLMWSGFALAAFFHLLRGLNNYFPDWPLIPAFQGKALMLEMTEVPWNVIGQIRLEFFFGAMGIAYMLPRDVSFSFWFFYLALLVQLVVAAQFGFPVGSLPTDSYTGRPTFISFSATGGWLMLAGMLLYAARFELKKWWLAVWYPDPDLETREPFSARFTVGGFLFCAAGMLSWCAFSGMNPIPAIAFWGLYLLIALVLSRLVVESGLIFPQVAFAPLDLLTKGVFGATALGPQTLTQFAVLQPSAFADMRSNLLPAWLHTLKMGHDLKLERSGMRRLLGASVLAVALSLMVSILTILLTVYAKGGLETYNFFTYYGARLNFTATAGTISKSDPVEPINWVFLASGAAVVLLLTMARSRFVWFPLNALGFIAAASPNTGRLAFSFFVGWIFKALILKYGGSTASQTFKMFAIGLILGNTTAMVLWLIFGFWKGSQITFWPA